MKEKEFDFPEEYIVEAKKLLNERLKKTEEHLKKISEQSKQNNIGRDLFIEEERRIRLEFNSSLEELKKKYGIIS